MRRTSRASGRLDKPLNSERLGLALGSVGWLGDTVDVRYLGPGDFIVQVIDGATTVKYAPREGQ